MSPEQEIEEIDNVAQAHTVDEVPDDTPQDEARGDVR